EHHPAYGTIASYLDISAPGGLPSNNDATVSVLSTWNDGGDRAIAGTSMATPHVSAAAALLIAAAPCTHSPGKTRLQPTATSLGSPNQFGAGLVNPNAAGAACTP